MQKLPGTSRRTDPRAQLRVRVPLGMLQRRRSHRDRAMGDTKRTLPLLLSLRIKIRENQALVRAQSQNQLIAMQLYHKQWEGPKTLVAVTRRARSMIMPQCRRCDDFYKRRKHR